MKYIVVICFLISFQSVAQDISPVTAGNSILASKMNELINKVNSLSSEVADLKKKELPVGTIMQSLLTQTQYQLENGDCWKLANGSPLSSTDDLRVITGMTIIPDAASTGAFLRQLKTGSSRLLGSYEDDQIKSHTHDLLNPANINFRSGSGGSGFTPGGSYNGPNYAPSIGNTGGEESRPKNIAVNMFVKFKKQCNF